MSKKLRQSLARFFGVSQSVSGVDKIRLKTDTLKTYLNHSPVGIIDIFQAIEASLYLAASNSVR